jgi:hypothetical protein
VSRQSDMREKRTGWPLDLGWPGQASLMRSHDKRCLSDGLEVIMQRSREIIFLTKGPTSAKALRQDRACLFKK